MMKQMVLVFLALLEVQMMVEAQQDAHIYCGRNLATTLSMLCPDGLMVKRGEGYVPGFNAAPQGWPWLPPHRARAMDRGKRQVVSECCDKPCTVDELLSYCA